MIASNSLLQLAAQLGANLHSRGARVTTAESCTGGGLAAAITEIPGSSQWFDRGFIVYSDAAKRDVLGIDQVLLQQAGAVSEAVVVAMAQAARLAAAADYAIAVTGLAGPEGDGSSLPVGTVWIAWASAKGTAAERWQFAGERAQVRAASLVSALEGLLSRIENNTV